MFYKSVLLNVCLVTDSEGLGDFKTVQFCFLHTKEKINNKKTPTTKKSVSDMFFFPYSNN